jgi:hypothetical protein
LIDDRRLLAQIAEGLGFTASVTRIASLDVHNRPRPA